MTQSAAAYTVYYAAAMLRNGAIKTCIQAERSAYDAMLSMKEELAPSSWDAIGIYTSIPTLAAFDGDSRHSELLGRTVRSAYFGNEDTPPQPPAPPVPGGVPYVPRTVMSYTKRNAEGATHATA